MANKANGIAKTSIAKPAFKVSIGSGPFNPLNDSAACENTQATPAIAIAINGIAIAP